MFLNVFKTEKRPTGPVRSQSFESDYPKKVINICFAEKKTENVRIERERSRGQKKEGKKKKKTLVVVKRKKKKQKKKKCRKTEKGREKEAEEKEVNEEEEKEEKEEEEKGHNNSAVFQFLLPFARGADRNRKTKREK